MKTTPSGITTDVSLEQLSNAYSPMLRTPDPIDTKARLSHWLKAKLEMFVTLSGIMTDCNDEQHPNASMPMSLTLAGIAIEERAPHESKRALGKRSIPLPKTTAFKPEPGPGAESLVQVDHLGLILARQAFVFGKFHPFGVSLEFAFCAGHVVTQLQNDDAQKFGHALGLGCLFGGEEFLFGKHEKNVEKVIKKLGRSSNK